jgi:hypothetical protein
MCQWPRTQVARVAGSASRSLVMRYTTSVVFLPFFVTVRRSCATWAAPWNSIQAGATPSLHDFAGSLRPRPSAITEIQLIAS